MAVFSASVYKPTVYLTGDSPQESGLLGGTFNDPYAHSDKQREAKRLREAQEEVIRLKQEQQQLRLDELEAQKASLEAKDKQTKRQLNAMNRRKDELAEEVARLMALISIMQQENQQRNAEALLVLSMAFPWMRIGGETMH